MADVRYADLVRKLTDRGWAVVQRERDVGWWADELWTVESVWAPRGFTLFVTWLVDPESLSGVWGVGAALERPTARHEAEATTCMSINHWPRYVPDFLKALDTLRDAANPST